MDSQNRTEIIEDDFLLNNLPNCQDMLSKILPHKDMLYYPPSSGLPSFVKVFDFASQKNQGEDDEFISIDTKTSSQAKNKSKQNKKNANAQYAQNTKQKQTAQNKNAYAPPQPKFKVSQTINPESSWKIIADFNKLTLEKLRLDQDTEVEVEEKSLVGNVYQLNEEMEERINPFNPLSLNKYDNMKFFGNITTLEDEMLKTADFANVFVTEKILSVIMTCVYNSHPWHLKIRKVANNIYIDKMENSEIDLVTVNESDNTPSDDDDRNINGYKSLAIEATLINEFIKEQMVDLKSKPLLTDNDNPFKDSEMKEEEVEHLGYRYRLFTIDDMKVIVRCQVHAYIPKDEESDSNEEEEEEEKEDEKVKREKVEYVNIYALNEFDKNSYLSKESNLIPLLLKKELQSNHLKLTKWGVNCYLAGVDKMKIGFVTRKNVKENNGHLISGFYDVSCDDLLKVTNFNKTIAWGIFKEIIEIIRRQKEDGAFIIMKTLGLTGAKSMLKLYKVPESTFKTENEDQ